MASHNLNDMSSRSHAMLSIQIEQDMQGYDDPNEQMTRQGKLVFVDLAGNHFSMKKITYSFFPLGSEKVKVSHSKGKQLVETNNINKSLLTLGNPKQNNSFPCILFKFHFFFRYLYFCIE